jgi:hypothetical protein
VFRADGKARVAIDWDSRPVFLATLRIVRISQDAEFVSSVSRSAAAAHHPDATIPTIQNRPLREIAAKQAAPRVRPSKNDMTFRRSGSE